MNSHRRARARAALAGLISAVAATIAPIAAQERGGGDSPATADPCSAMPAAEVEAVLASAGLTVTVTGARGGTSSCTYRFSDASMGLVIEAAQAGSPSEATDALRSLRGMARDASNVEGVGDAAFVVDQVLDGATSVKYRAGRFYGRVNLRGQHGSRKAATVALAEEWVDRLAGVMAVADAQSPPTSAAAPAPVRAAPPPRAARPAIASPAPAPRVGARPALGVLAWPDAESDARARGLVPWVHAPTLQPDVPPLLQTLRVLGPGVGADSIMSAEAWTEVEALARELDAWTTARRRQLHDSVAGTAGDTVVPLRSLGDAGPLSHDAALAFDTEPQRGAGGPRAPSDPPAWSYVRRTTGVGLTSAAAPRSAPRPEWFERSFEKDVPAQSVGNGTTTAARTAGTWFQRPWEVGENETREMVISRSSDGLSGSTTTRSRHQIAVDLCPGPDGIVRGRGTVEHELEARVQDGARALVRRLAGTADVEIIGRVDDQAILRGYDVFITATVSRGQTSSGADLPQYVEATYGAGSINNEPGVGFKDPNVPEADWSGFYPEPGEDYIEGEPANADDAYLLAVLNSNARNEATTYLRRAMRNWWDQGCMEIRVAQTPNRTRLRPGDSASFALEIWHYQDGAAVALPLEAFVQAVRTGPGPINGPGEISPASSSNSPAAFTFTAPLERDAPNWTASEIFAQTVSRRGIAGGYDLPVFTKRERESFAVTVRRSVTSEREGEIREVIWNAMLRPKPDDPSALTATGSFSGFLRDVARHTSTCAVEWDRTIALGGTIDADGSLGTLAETPDDLFGDQTLYIVLRSRGWPQPEGWTDPEKYETVYSSFPDGIKLGGSDDISLGVPTDGSRSERRAPCAGGCDGEEQVWCTTVEEVTVRPLPPGK